MGFNFVSSSLPTSVSPREGMTGIDGSSFYGLQAEGVRDLVNPATKNKCKLAQSGEERFG